MKRFFTKTILNGDPPIPPYTSQRNLKFDKLCNVEILTNDSIWLTHFSAMFHFWPTSTPSNNKRAENLETLE